MTSDTATPGAEKWSFYTGGHVHSTPVLSGDGATVFVASNSDQLYALDAATGAEVEQKDSR